MCSECGAMYRYSFLTCIVVSLVAIGDVSCTGTVCGNGPISTGPDLKHIFAGRCQEYQYVVNPNQFCGVK